MTSIIHSHIRALRGPIIVTGAAGFIGANLFKSIAAIRDDVFGIVRKEKGWRLAQIDDEKIIVADLNDWSATKNLVDSLRPQTVFNCAAYGAYSFENEEKLIYQTNFTSVVHLTSLLSQYSFAAFVQAGSSSEYGTNCAAPSEDAHCDPNSLYSVSKIATATHLNYLGKHRNFPCVNLRLYSVYGPLEDTSRLIPNVLIQANAGKFPPFVAREISRDFVFIDDVVEAFVVAASKMHPGLYGESFNIGSGSRTTIADLAAVVGETFHIIDTPQFGNMDGRTWDMPDWFAFPKKALDALGWKARTSLQSGLQATNRWVQTLKQEELADKTKKGKRHDRRSISAIIACYKDEPAIPIMYQRLSTTLQKIGVDYEIIFVNDGSPDNSWQVICDLSSRDPRVLGISHSRNFGSQMAFRSGMELSTKDAVVLLDGDLQDPPELIEDFHKQWENGWDVVYGRRVKREMSRSQEMLYKLFYRVFSKFSYIPIPRDAGDFSLIDKRVVGWLLKCPERDLFVRGLRAYVGFRQTGVDYIRPERMFGRSTNNFWKNIGWAKKGIFSFSDTPLTMLTAAGIGLLALSLIAAVIVALLRIMVPDIAPRGITTLLITTLFFGSLNLFAIGLVGEYVAKIMAEVKERPRLIRSALARHGQITELLPNGKAR